MLRGPSRSATRIHIAVSPKRPSRRPLTSLGLDHRARHAVAAVPGRLADLVVLAGVDDEGATDRPGGRVEERRRAGRDRDTVRGRVEMPDALGVDDEVGQVAGVGAVRIVEPVLVAERVVVAAGRGERRAAGADRVDVDSMEARASGQRRGH